jgi:DNA processing protein
VLQALAPLSQIDLLSGHEAKEPASDEEHQPTPPPSDSDRTRITDALGPTPGEIDNIVRHTGLAPAAVYLVLLELDIAGRLHRHPGGLVSIAMMD